MENKINLNERNKSGIYCIQSKVNNKKYIGSSCNISKRYRMHLHHLRVLSHNNQHLINHVKKYGIKSLYFYVIELCNIENLIEREQYHIDNNTDLFNCRIIADRNDGIKWTEEMKQKFIGRKHSEKTKEKIRQLHLGNTYRLGKKLSEESKIKIGLKSKGRVLTEEAKCKLSKALKGRVISEKTKDKLSKALKGNKNGLGSKHPIENMQAFIDKLSIPVLQFKEGIFIKEWKSTIEASRTLKINRGNIHACIAGKRKIAGGFLWKKK